jgi:3'-phosphoadenosine 5'-phosphosulfate sulfotransferase (PAPS reductase)/FAD synthetase
LIPDLSSYDVILINTSAGKDSQATLDYLYQLPEMAGLHDRIVTVHADLGRVEWPGTRELAERQVDHYGARFEVVSRPHSKKCKCGTDHPNGDLLHQLEFERHKFPDNNNRWCTSDQKTAQVLKLITRLVAERWNTGGLVRELDGTYTKRKVRILNCLGIRGQESKKRAKYEPFSLDDASWSNKKKGILHGKRHVDRWYPIFDWTIDEVWARIRQSGVEYHPAYDLGMPRLSCCFCVFASKSALTLSARHNPELAQEYVGVEIRTSHKIRQDLSMAEVVWAANTADALDEIEDWAA